MLDDVIRNQLSIKNPSSDRNVQFDDPRHIVGRLKTPSKGYWSDNDSYPVISRKKTNGLLPNSYQVFKRAHRWIASLITVDRSFLVEV